MEQSMQHRFSFENLLMEAFRLRDERKSHWADGLLHLVPHEQVAHVGLHHQHAQYHQVLFWIENLFPQAGQWLGARELARLILDFLENHPVYFESPVVHAEKLIDLLSSKRAHLHVAQLEALMRCGLACWNVRTAAWRADLGEIPRDRKFSFMTLIEHKQAAFVESPGPWSIFDLWDSAQSGKMREIGGEPDVFLVFRKDQHSLDFERIKPAELKERLESYLE